MKHRESPLTPSTRRAASWSRRHPRDHVQVGSAGLTMTMSAPPQHRALLRGRPPRWLAWVHLVRAPVPRPWARIRRRHGRVRTALWRTLRLRQGSRIREPRHVQCLADRATCPSIIPLGADDVGACLRLTPGPRIQSRVASLLTSPLSSRKPQCPWSVYSFQRQQSGRSPRTRLRSASQRPDDCWTIRRQRRRRSPARPWRRGARRAERRRRPSRSSPPPSCRVTRCSRDSDLARHDRLGRLGGPHGDERG